MKNIGFTPLLEPIWSGCILTTKSNPEVRRKIFQITYHGKGSHYYGTCPLRKITISTTSIGGVVLTEEDFKVEKKLRKFQLSDYHNSRKLKNYGVKKYYGIC